MGYRLHKSKKYGIVCSDTRYYLQLIVYCDTIRLLKIKVKQEQIVRFSGSGVYFVVSVEITQ
jgi:hypothetical protein